MECLTFTGKRNHWEEGGCTRQDRLPRRPLSEPESLVQRQTLGGALEAIGPDFCSHGLILPQRGTFNTWTFFFLGLSYDLGQWVHLNVGGPKANISVLCSSFSPLTRHLRNPLPMCPAGQGIL